MVKFSVHKASYSAAAKIVSPPHCALEFPLGVLVGDVRHEVASSLRAALAAALGECGETLNQGNAKSRGMISCYPPQATGLLAFFLCH